MTRLAPYAGEKGKLRFLRRERMPYSLIGEIAGVRARQNVAKAHGEADAREVTVNRVVEAIRARTWSREHQGYASLPH